LFHHLYSHQTRIVLAEKGVNVEIILANEEHWPDEIAEHNPKNEVPILVDRDLVLYNSRIVMEYLDERFPHPPLMPVYPVERGKSRLLMQRVETEWYPLVAQIMGNDLSASDAARIKLREQIIMIASIFDHFTYFMSEDFTLVDCYMAPLLWRLPELEIELPQDLVGLKSYMVRVFERESFQASMTETEREIRVGG